MAKRLNEKFQRRETVEIFLKTVEGGRWIRGIVDGFSFPGVWVRGEDGARWFVTNSRRIRSVDGPNEE